MGDPIANQSRSTPLSIQLERLSARATVSMVRMHHAQVLHNGNVDLLWYKGKPADPYAAISWLHIRRYCTIHRCGRVEPRLSLSRSSFLQMPSVEIKTAAPEILEVGRPIFWNATTEVRVLANPGVLPVCLYDQRCAHSSRGRCVRLCDEEPIHHKLETKTLSAIRRSYPDLSEAEDLLSAILNERVGL
jgi:hypothetical protein